MSSDFSDRIKHFNDCIEEASSYSSMARDRTLQQEAKKSVTELLALLKVWKQESIAEKNEDQANLVLGMECAASALEAELSMWLLLKEENPDEAWNQLIAAQTATSQSVRAHQGFAHLENRARMLEAIEKFVFPPQVFFSAGMIVKKQICTICNQDYEDCDHLVGLPYWGEFCFRELKDITPDHVAIVKEPANKRCRVTHFDVEGGKRNRMTWKIEATQGVEQPNEGGGLTATGIFLTIGDLTC